MALRIWLPLNGNLNNQGLGKNANFTSGTYSYDTNGKIGKSLSVSTTTETNLPIDLWDYSTSSISMGCWIKMSVSEMRSAIEAQSYDGIYQYGGGSIIGRCSYGGFALRWQTNKIYNSSFSSLVIYASLRGSSMYSTSEINVVSDEWIHIFTVFDRENGKLLLYKNGTLFSTTTLDMSKLTQEALSNFLGTLLLHQNSIDGGNKRCPNAPIHLCDVRVYDEALSPKQIKEIAKGLVAHYKLDNPYVETTTNMAPGINGLTSYSTNSSPAWDTSLNGSVMYTPSNWSSGYNSGVSDPTHGYHAHWVFDETNKLIMIFPNLNSVINQKNRWLGISGTCSGTSDILAGEKYTISWWQKTDNLGLTASGGVYYKKTSSASSNFGDGCPIFGYNTKLNTWQFFSKTFTRASDYVQHSGGQSIYVYGNNGSEGTLYVKDVQIQKGDNATPYTVGTRNGQTYEEDCSGYGYNGIVSGSLKYNTDSARHSGSIYFNANCANYIYRPHLTFLTGPLTYNCWVYQVSATPATQFIMSQGRDNTCNGFNLSCANGIPKLWAGGNDKIQITGTTSIVDSKWHMLTGTWDGTTAKLYVDGTLIGSAAMGDITYTQSSGAFVIGKMSYSYTSTANYFPFNGSISDAKIYATALSADDILTMYKTSGIIDNKGNVYSYEFKEE